MQSDSAVEAGVSGVAGVAGVRVRVPATSANLGPGFDAFGLALGLHDEVVARVSTAGLRVLVEGEGAGEVPRDEGHLVLRAMSRAFAAMGRPMPAVELFCANRIPHGRGLGSSAAAVVAGLLAARALVPDGVRRLPDDVVLALAAEQEGHPDNVAPCLHGGFTIAWSEVEAAGDGPVSGAVSARLARLEANPSVQAVAFVPSQVLATRVARGLLPDTVPHRDAARNAGRAGLLVEALTRRPELLLPATEDRLHQGYRAAAMPESAALLADLRGQGVAAVVSGAGPTVLALCSEAAARELTASGPARYPAFRVLPLSVAAEGAVVTVL